MQQQLTSLILFLLLKSSSWADGPVTQSQLTQKSQKALQRGEFIIKSEVQTINKEQSFHFEALGLHPQHCQKAMQKLSRYEQYPNWIDFIKSVNYSEATSRVSFLLGHFLLPYNMSLSFKLPRITKAGVYNYSFDQGFLKGLTGLIELKEDETLALEKRRCLFSGTAHWQGPDTRIPDSVFELFTITLTRTAMEKLFRLSSMGP